MRNKCECPKEVKKAVRALARAVKLVVDLADLPSPDPLTEYHTKEYLEEMEVLLIHQLLTAYDSKSEREKLLSDFELDYLAERMNYLEQEWEESS